MLDFFGILGTLSRSPGRKRGNEALCNDACNHPAPFPHPPSILTPPWLMQVEPFFRCQAGSRLEFSLVETDPREDRLSREIDWWILCCSSPQQGFGLRPFPTLFFYSLSLPVTVDPARSPGWFGTVNPGFAFSPLGHLQSFDGSGG